MKNLLRKITIVSVGLIMLFTMVTVQASQVNNDAVYPISTNTIEEWPQGPDIYSETAVLMDADTGAILYNKGMDEKRYPASITKIMTCLLALEHANLEEQVTFTEVCLPDQAAGSGNIGMQVGEVLTMKQCLYALMIQSANDVATQIAEYVGGGSVTTFVDMMNQKAQELGCGNTHFVNASGMPDENHYTTAYDMALIFREAIKNETFREIIATQSVQIGPTNMNPETRTYSTHHPLVARSAPEYYEGCIGGKTGITDASRNTLVSGAEKNGMTLIAVAMRADAGEVCQDHINLFNYGFYNFQRVAVPGGNVTIPVGKDVSELDVVETVSGDLTAEAYFYKKDYYVGSGIKEELTPEPELTIEPEPELQGETGMEKQPTVEPESMDESEQEMGQTYRYIIYILAGLIGLSIIIAIISALKKKSR